jgi:hypothetical protein
VRVLVEVVAQCRNQDAVERDVSNGLFGLRRADLPSSSRVNASPSHGERPPQEIDVADLQALDLARAEPGVRRQPHQQSVRGAVVERRSQRLDLRCREEVLRGVV